MRKAFVFTSILILFFSSTSYSEGPVIEETWNDTCTRCVLDWTDGDPVYTGPAVYTLNGCTQHRSEIVPWKEYVGIPKGWITCVITVPGTPAPSDGYDVIIRGEYGCEIMGGELMDRSATVPQQATARIGNAYDKRFIDYDRLTFKIEGNSVPLAKGKVVIFIERWLPPR